MDLANNCSSQQSAGKGWAYLVVAHRRRRAQRRRGVGQPRQEAMAESPVAMAVLLVVLLAVSLRIPSA